MSGPPPPPPPPHGEAPKTTAGGGLPPGKYDIFVIPQHSAGSGFLYLPSLRPNVNSFIAGFASAMALIALGQTMAPAFQVWWSNFQGMGNMGMMMLTVAVGLGAWSLGRQQNDGGGGSGAEGTGPTGGGGHSHHPGAGFGGASQGASSNSAPPPPPPPNTGPPPPNPPPPQHEPPPQEKPKASWQRPPPQPGTTRTETPKGAWERARDEMRRKEEERRAQEAEQKRKEATAQRLRELREKEAREREQREKERREREAKEAKEKEDKERKEREETERREKEREKEVKEKREKEQREREQREQRARELRAKLEREAKERERLKKEQEEKTARVGSTYAFSAMGEKTNPWPNGKPPVATASQPASPSTANKPPPPATPSAASTKRPPPPTARSYAGTEDDAYSYRPYDKPKRPTHKKSNSDLSEASWAPSQSTSRTTPPPSFRAPYSTKDPDKIVIKAVYGFLNQFAKTPSSQLISGFGSVTDGLILRITTEGLFIDDDVRGVAQREWDVKAWTLKLVEVWCPAHIAAIANSAAAEEPVKPSAANTNNASFLHKLHQRRSAAAASRGEPKTLVNEDADAYLTDMLRECKGTCRIGLGDAAASCAFGPSASASGSGSARSSSTNSSKQTGEWKLRGLHMLRATIRDQEGKRYLFVVGEEEGWKVAMGLQRLRRGTQTRALGVQGLSALETKNTLEVLGWGQ